MSLRLIAFVAFGMIPGLSVYANDKKPAPPDLRPAAITAAHTVFLVNEDTSATPAVYQSFRATLESTHRFTLSPTPLGADLLLIFSTAHSDNGFPTISLSLRDAHTASMLGKVSVRWAVLPTEKKNSEAVGRLMTDLLMLDGSGPMPTIHVVSVPEETHKRQFLGALQQSVASLGPSPRQLPGIGTTVAEAKTVLVVDDGVEIYAEYKQASAVFAANLSQAGRFRVVSDLKDADLLLRVTGYEYCAVLKDIADASKGCKRYEKALRVEVDSTATLGFLFAVSMDVSRNAEKSMTAFEAAFDRREHDVEAIR